MDLLLAGVLALLAIAAATAVAPKLGVAAPLLLVLVGLGVGLLPAVPSFEIDPEWILAGVLPPLLYSAAVSMPAMEFRRDFGAISGLSIVLVVITAVLLGLLFAWLIPGLGIAWGIALGAIVSPTDAVATSIVKRLGVSPRVVAMLEGESLLNDASALVLLRAAIAGAAASVSIWGVAASFVYSIVIAAVIGVVVGWVNLRVRARIANPTVNTVISFTMPFLAAIPAEHLGASGLVAAVVAGLVTGRGAARFLSPQHRLSDAQNWRTVELVLEGAVFLVMGLELTAIVADVEAAHEGAWFAVGLAAIALTVTVLIRAAFVAPLLAALSRRASRAATIKGVIADRAAAGAASLERGAGPGRERGRAAIETKHLEHRASLGADRRAPQPSAARTERFRTMWRRRVADIDYLLAQPLGWREGTIVVWAGMRGVVTLAAAQTLPSETPSRSLLVLIAFVVAVGSLLVQGGTLPWLVHRLLPARDPGESLAERRELEGVLRSAAMTEMARDDDPAVREVAERMRAAWQVSNAEGASDGEADAAPDTDDSNAADESGGATATAAATMPPAASDRRIDPEQVRLLRLRMIEAERTALLDARDDGTFSAAALSAALEDLDAEQISVELKGTESG
ncbi:cation:proton antiporter [Agromyces cerinus]|uniref:Sodium/proton antiporter, CPA1 family n=1 Tax=Agromyces cerinus subsp. cerinus TaxID=232089 RepID=A0A1N6G6U2_9MICO|nr:sodium:proton antiporter [Agromyces cerinus]SIO03238.1 sodium/proton antiporter, CPA1 family [Agromyces cerinus subsp. cerinus]